MDELTRRQFMISMLHLLALATLPGCRTRSTAPVLGKTPITAPFVVEDHHRLLSYWAEQGVRDAVLINIDTHDDFRLISDTKITALDAIYRRRDWQSFRADHQAAEQNLYHIGNWIYAGARLGIFNEIYWVIPFNYFSQKNPDAQLRLFLSAYGVSAEDIRTFTLRDNRFHGFSHGMPVTICGLESLPDISRPLLLSVDVDFFPTYSSQYQAPYLAAVHSLFEALDRKNYLIQSAAVCYSVNGDYYLPPQLRWVGDLVIQILQKPALLNESPSEVLALLQQMDNAYRSNSSGELRAITDQFLPRYQTTAAFLLYAAYAYLQQGDYDKAYTSAVECCRLDRLYVTALPFIGMKLFMNGNYIQAEKFFSAGYSLDPKMSNGLFLYGHCLRKLGRFEEAIRAYEREVALAGPFPTQFFIVETYALTGNRQAAVKALDTALAELENNRYAHVVSQVTAGSLYAVMDFCERNGLKDPAARLRKNQAFVRMLREYPIR